MNITKFMQRTRKENFLLKSFFRRVCPFGIKDNVKVYLDESMKRFETMLPACGTANSAIELTLEELEKASNYIEWIDVLSNLK